MNHTTMLPVGATIRVCEAEPGLVHVKVEAANSTWQRGEVWFSRENLAWVIVQLGRTLATVGFLGRRTRRGEDTLELVSGRSREGVPLVYGLLNTRTGRYEGSHQVTMLRETGEAILRQLVALWRGRPLRSAEGLHAAGAPSRQEIHVSEPEEGLIQVQVTEDNPHVGTYEESLWFSRDNLPWVVEQLRSLAENAWRPGETEQRRLDDFILVGTTGSAHPFVRIENERGGTSPGSSSVFLTVRSAEALLAALQARLEDASDAPGPVPSIDVSEPSPGLLLIRHVGAGKHVRRLESPLWLSRENLPWLIAQLTRRLTSCRVGASDRHGAGDHLTIAGHRGEHGDGILSLENQRSGQRASRYTVDIPSDVGRELLFQLAQLHAAAGDGPTRPVPRPPDGAIAAPRQSVVASEATPGIICVCLTEEEHPFLGRYEERLWFARENLPEIEALLANETAARRICGDDHLEARRPEDGPDPFYVDVYCRRCRPFARTEVPHAGHHSIGLHRDTLPAVARELRSLARALETQPVLPDYARAQVSEPEPGLVHVRVDAPRSEWQGGEVRFSRENLAWVIVELSRALAYEYVPTRWVARGSDTFWLSATGNDRHVPALYRLGNTRDARTAGVQEVTVMRETGEAILRGLVALRRRAPSGSVRELPAIGTTGPQAVAVSAEEDGEVCIRVTEDNPYAGRYDESVSFSRDNLPWMLEKLSDIAEKGWRSGSHEQLRGDDDLRIRTGNSKHPCVTIENERRGGRRACSSVFLTAGSAAELLTQLRARLGAPDPAEPVHAIDVCEPAPGLVLIRHTGPGRYVPRLEAPLWIARENLAWLVAQLTRRMTARRSGTAIRERADDHLAVAGDLSGGGAGVLAVRNRRSGRRGSRYEIQIPPALGRELLVQLAWLHAGGSGGPPPASWPEDGVLRPPRQTVAATEPAAGLVCVRVTEDPHPFLGRYEESLWFAREDLACVERLVASPGTRTRRFEPIEATPVDDPGADFYVELRCNPFAPDAPDGGDHAIGLHRDTLPELARQLRALRRW